MKYRTWWLHIGVLAAALGGSTILAAAETKPAETRPGEISIKGTCVFQGKSSTWSAKLTPKGNDMYAAVYKATWGGKPLDYVGTVKSDLKTSIKGEGKASGKGANGNFEFAGKFGEDGIAKCTYQEVGGGRGRQGTMTVDPPK